MTIQELAARDLKRAKINYLKAKERSGTPADELAHLKELMKLRERILWVVNHHGV